MGKTVCGKMAALGRAFFIFLAPLFLWRANISGGNMRFFSKRKVLTMVVMAQILALLALGATPLQLALAKVTTATPSVTPVTPVPPVTPAPPPPSEGSIAVTVVNPPAGAWAAVQWSLPGGSAWVNVDTWTSPLKQDEYGWMAHWVDPKDYGAGPFRWVVYDKDPSQGGEVWGTSASFYFPTKHGEVVWSQVTATTTK
jgi:hypothetical protein